MGNWSRMVRVTDTLGPRPAREKGQKKGEKGEAWENDKDAAEMEKL